MPANTDIDTLTPDERVNVLAAIAAARAELTSEMRACRDLYPDRKPLGGGALYFSNLERRMALLNSAHRKLGGGE